MADEDPAPGPDLPALVEAVRADLLGGEGVYTNAEVAERAGLSLDDARALWRALGFATVDDDARVFTAADVAALEKVEELRRVGDIDDELMHSMTRILGQTFARLASWQGQLVTEIIAKSPELLADASGEPVLDLLQRLKPVITDLHTYVWSRQLAAYFARIAANASAEPGTETSMTVGFVDMAEFTAFTRRSSEAELRDVLGRFETVATEVVGAHGGQVVKTIGDEVLFVADGAKAGADIALGLLAAAEADDALPPFRAGVAYGPVVTRLGDVFGQTVNIASRLTSVARTGSVLVDEGLAARLQGDDRYALRSLRPVSVRGYNHLKSWRLRSA